METNNKEIKVNELPTYKFTTTEAKKPYYKGTAREFLRARYNKSFVFGIDNLKSYGYFKIMGWTIDFGPIMKKFIVKQYDNLYEAYAYNKTDLRKSIFGRIDYIMEIKK